MRRDGDRFVATTQFCGALRGMGLRNPSLLTLRRADTVYVDPCAQGRVIWVAAESDGARQAAMSPPHPVPH